MIRVRPNLPERFQLNRRGNLQGLVSLLRDAMGDFVKYYGHEISFATSFNFRLEDLESARKANDMPFDTKVWCVIHLLASGFPMGLAFKIAYQGYNVFSPHHQSLVKESLGVLTETDIKNKSFICNRCLDMRYTFPLTSRFPLSPVPCVCSDLFQRVLFLMYLTRSVSSKDEDGKKVYELYNNLVKRLGPLWEKYPGFRQLVQMHIPENFLHWVKGESPKLELLDWSDYRQRPIPKELIPGIIEDIIAKVLRECTH